jgi:DNA repair protein RecO (recombination protein O)
VASPSYSTDVVVIRKTKLSESDLILDMVSAQATLIRAVAKSARKPGNTFSNRLDLFNIAHITCAKCKSLDIIRECSLIEQHDHIRTHLPSQTAASAIAELVWRLTWDGDVNDHLFDFLVKTFSLLDKSTNDHQVILQAALLKLLALSGLRPALNKCCKCETDINTTRCKFSYIDGGAICQSCFIGDNVRFDIIDSSQLSFMNFLLSSKYEDILCNLKGTELNNSVLRIVDRWIQFHVGYRLKALELYYSFSNSIPQCTIVSDKN